MNNVNENFFVIDSENLAEIGKKIYGFCIYDDGSIQIDGDLNPSKLTRLGSYVYIDVDTDEIVLYQDFNGSYGLYLYQNEDYFALSNSFIKLVEYLKETEHVISLNKDYANAFLFAELVSIAYDETMVNEIESLPRNYEIHINKSDKRIDFKEIDFKENSVEMDSQEGIELLDKWFYKWINIIRYIKSISNNISLDLTGGFDSRVISTIWINANINLDEVRINSYHDDKHTHPEDFRIASEIGKEFGFRLNRNFDTAKISYDNMYTSLFNSFYPKLCFHTEMNYKPYRYEYPVYHLTGSAGGGLRGFPNRTSAEFIRRLKKHVAKYDPSLNESVERLFNRTIDKISAKYNLDKDSKEIISRHYKETRSRYHPGKQSVEYFLINDYLLNPLLDEELYMLKRTTKDCDDERLLFALILSRYCPKLLNFDFDSNRSFDENTLKYAKELNEKFPWIPKKFDKISKNSDSIEEKHETNSNSFEIKDIDKFLENIFYSKSFEMEFKKHFSDLSYNKIHNIVQKLNYFPLKFVCTSIGILKTINAIEYNNLRNKNEEYWFDNFLENSTRDNKTRIIKESKLTKYITSRIDIKSFGKDNKIEILYNSDSLSSVNRPRWFKNNAGEGVVIESDKGSIDLEIKTINEGKLKIWFRGIDYRDNNNKRFPIYINYIRSTINGEEILKNKLLWHDEPLIFDKKVMDCEIIKIHAEWEPVSENSIFENTLKLENKNIEERMKTLNDENKSLKNEINAITQENENLKNEINTINAENENLKKEMVNVSPTLSKTKKRWRPI